MTKKIVYVTHARLPTHKAHGRAVVKLCEAFAKYDVSVELIYPRLWFGDALDIFSYYDVRPIFSVWQIATLDLAFLRIFERITYPIRFLSFSIIAGFQLWWKYRHQKDDVVFFSHDSLPLYVLSFFFPYIFYDIHDFPGRNIFFRRVMRRATGFSVQTQNKVALLHEHFGIPESAVMYWPNGTDVALFAHAPDKAEARKKLLLPTTVPIVVYTGQLFDWKGGETLVRAAAYLPENVRIFMVGGADKDVKRIKREIPDASYERVTFVSSQPHRTIPLWLRAADVLVLPNTGTKDISRFWTSPMKLFEYMASGRPIVASDIPSITEILHEKNAFLAEADNPQSFADAISFALVNPNAAAGRGKQAQEDAKKYTWDARAKKILFFMQKRMSSIVVTEKRGD